MPRKRLIGSVVILILLAACAWVWRLKAPSSMPEVQTPGLAKVPPPVIPARTTGVKPFPLLTRAPALNLAPAPVAPVEAKTYVDKKTLRISNTQKPIKELMRLDTAVLLRNAFLDTTEPLALEMPESLRRSETPAAYIVQSQGLIGDRFRASLSAAGASVIAYIPNNAYLVEASQDAAERLGGAPGVKSVLPYEPYYKLDSSLLKVAVKNESLEQGQLLNVTLFAGRRDQGLDAIRSTGAEILQEGTSPFGPIVTIAPQPESLSVLAQIAGVQTIEACHQKMLLNDLTRVRTTVSADSLVTTNYLGLTGSNVLVTLNDSGVDVSHPDLTGRVIAMDRQYLFDGVGHGTHVAGIIAGSGSKSSTVTNAPGSKTGANFRGMAPGAKLLILPVDLDTGPVISDAYLQQTPAKTNSFIINNSWGYRNSYAYDSSSASFDASVRDALPSVSGSQPLLFVFSAGNDGFGNEDGSGGDLDTIHSPGNAKNVITVGALDQLRNITNEVYITNADLTVSTNTPFAGNTDSDDEVSTYSSRGNVGVGVEGEFGRFKPDVVAPGSFLVSTRSSAYEMELFPRTTNIFTYPVQNIAPEGFNVYSFIIPFGAVSAEIRVQTSLDSSNSFPGLPIYAKQGEFPTKSDLAGTSVVRFPEDLPLTMGEWYYAIGNDSTEFVDYVVTEIIVQTNSVGNRYEVLKELDDGLAPYYRYESGTSMAAPVVSGMLALMQEFFTQKLPAGLRLTNSPALMKALLINGARSVNGRYDLQVAKELNVQGWGLVNLTNSIPEAMKDGKMTNSPVQFVDQNTTNALATGETRSWRLSVLPDAMPNPLRVTLVWTDPPGNPNAAIKLVNDLDLIVTNRDTGEVYFGNDITSESDWNMPTAPGAAGTNDMVNNVENVFLSSANGTNIDVAVYARRVNVNAVTQQTNRIAQDFALVISTGSTEITNAFTMATLAFTNSPRASMALTNGLPLLNQHVGANLPTSTNPNGSTNQWNFYVFTNTMIEGVSLMTNGSNVAFVTFQTPDLAVPRNVEGDIDLYVSTNPALTNLNAAAIAGATKSLQRGGVETVFFTNAPLNAIYYIGVKSEDQQGVEFGLIALSSNQPFDEDRNGERVLHGMPPNLAIPDGSPLKPGKALMFAIATRPIEIGRVMVDAWVAHDNLGDLTMNLSHNRKFSVLLNHSLNGGFATGTNEFFFDDSNEGDNFNSRSTDGPGSLTDFIAEQSMGAWILTTVDSGLSQSGTIQTMDILIDPNTANTGLISTVQANSWDYFAIDVPVEATNLNVFLWDFTPPLPLNLYVRRGDIPTFTAFDKSAIVDPNLFAIPTAKQNVLQIGTTDLPPLNAGRYYIGIFNPNALAVTYRIDASLDYDLLGNAVQRFVATNTPLDIIDDAVTISANNVPIDRQILEARVGVRIDHPRLSDLALRLVSPQGTRVLLSENRGGTNATAFGSGKLDGTNLVYTGFTDNTNLTIMPIKFAVPPFTTTTNQTVVNLSDFDSVVATNYYATNTAITVNGWRVLTNYVSVISTNDADSGTNVLALNLGRISRVLQTKAGREYRLTFAYNSANDDFVNAQIVLDGVLQPWISNTNTGWQKYVLTFVANQDNNELEIAPALNRPGILLDTFILSESGSTIYYLPEESLEIYQAERSLGDWKLEISDTRKGPDSPTIKPMLIGWEMQMVLATPSQYAVTLTNGVEYTHAIFGNEPRYFVVNVPRSATVATNWLWGTGSLDLFGRRAGLPVGDPLTDEYFRRTGGAGLLAEQIITTTSPIAAPLQPGHRYYLEVKNTNPNETNVFTILVSFDRDDPKYNFDLKKLTNGVVQAGSISNGAAMDYYQFDVPTNAVSAKFELFPTNGNVNLLLRKATQVDNPLPTTSSYHYRSGNTGTNVDTIIVTTNSSPVPLTPGAWYVAVFNMESFTVNYGIRATASTSFTTNIVALANDVPIVNYTVGPGSAVYDFFNFKITETNSGARFQLYNQNGNGDLILKRGSLPSETNYDVGSFTPTTLGEQILLRTNNEPASLTLPNLNGEWYLAVLNQGTDPLTFSLRGVVTPPITPLTNGVIANNVILPGGKWQYYGFDVSSNATMAMFESFPTNGDLTLYVSQASSDLEPWPTLTRFDYVSWPPGMGQVVVFTNSTPAALAPGTWYVGVYNSGTNSVAYSVRATEYYDALPTIVSLTNNVPFDTTISTTNGMDYYLFTVSSNAYKAVFETMSTNGNVDLYLRRGLPLPNSTNAHYWSTNSGTNSEQIVVATNATPVALAPGIWLLSVSNVDVSPVSYSIKAWEFLQQPSTNIVPIISFTKTNLSITWASQIGTNYYVAARTNITDSGWIAVSPTITATNTITTYLLTLPTPYTFFTVFEGVSPLGGGTNTPISINPNLIHTKTNLGITWTSQAGTNYYVGARTNITDSGWIAVSPTITATSTTTTFLLPLPTPYSYFRVFEGASPLGGGTNTPVIIKVDPSNSSMTTNGFKITWTANPGLKFKVDYSTNLFSTSIYLGTTTSVTSSYEFTDVTANKTTGLRIYRVAETP